MRPLPREHAPTVPPCGRVTVARGTRGQGLISLGIRERALPSTRPARSQGESVPTFRTLASGDRSPSLPRGTQDPGRENGGRVRLHGRPDLALGREGPAVRRHAGLAPGEPDEAGPLSCSRWVVKRGLDALSTVYDVCVRATPCFPSYPSFGSRLGRRSGRAARWYGNALAGRLRP